MKKIKTIQAQVVYVADPLSEEHQLDFYRTVLRPLKENGWEFKDENNIFIYESLPPDSYFDVLFYDYGGLLPGASELIDSNSRWIINAATDNPSKAFVMVSQFTAAMVKDIQDSEFDDDNIPNLFMSIEDYINNWLIL